MFIYFRIICGIIALLLIYDLIHNYLVQKQKKIEPLPIFQDPYDVIYNLPKVTHDIAKHKFHVSNKYLKSLLCKVINRFDVKINLGIYTNYMTGIKEGINKKQINFILKIMIKYKNYPSKFWNELSKYKYRKPIYNHLFKNYIKVYAMKYYDYTYYDRNLNKIIYSFL